jgi:hypothetical protein
MVGTMALVNGMKCLLPSVFVGFFCTKNLKMNLDPKIKQYILINSHNLNPN